jgi:hypothetical protein
MVAHTGLEPVISALRGQRVNQLHQCAVETMVIIGVECKSWQTRLLAPEDIRSLQSVNLRVNFLETRKWQKKLPDTLERTNKENGLLE